LAPYKFQSSSTRKPLPPRHMFQGLTNVGLWGVVGHPKLILAGRGSPSCPLFVTIYLAFDLRTDAPRILMDNYLRPCTHLGRNGFDVRMDNIANDDRQALEKTAEFLGIPAVELLRFAAERRTSSVSAASNFLQPTGFPASRSTLHSYGYPDTLPGHQSTSYLGHSTHATSHPDVSSMLPGPTSSTQDPFLNHFHLSGSIPIDQHALAPWLSFSPPNSASTPRSHSDLLFDDFDLPDQLGIPQGDRQTERQLTTSTPSHPGFQATTQHSLDAVPDYGSNLRCEWQAEIINNPQAEEEDLNADTEFDSSLNDDAGLDKDEGDSDYNRWLPNFVPGAQPVGRERSDATRREREPGGFEQEIAPLALAVSASAPGPPQDNGYHPLMPAPATNTQSDQRTKRKRERATYSPDKKRKVLDVRKSRSCVRCKMGRVKVCQACPCTFFPNLPNES
jgi:hypothetical protein